MKYYRLCIKMVLMDVKLKKIIKEIVIFSLLLLLLTNGISFYRGSSLPIDDAICSDGSDVVHFWATWCPVCKAEASNIAYIAKHYKVKTVAVKSGDANAIKEYLQQNGVDFSFVVDRSGALAEHYGIEVFPTTVVCSKKKVAFVEVGYSSTLGMLLRLWMSK
jgi:thiol-disulfide isomerase/thioredoxin